MLPLTQCDHSLTHFIRTLLALLVLPACVASAADVVEAPLELWYSQPAKNWTEALPIGNGSLGGMVFGGTDQERIQFNEDTLWTGIPRDYSRPGAKDHLPRIRQLLFDGKQREAEQLAMDHFMSDPLRQMAYQPFGDLRLDLGHHEVGDYRRNLVLDSAVTSVSYRVGPATYTRESFCSFPDQVLVVRLSCDLPGQISFHARLDTPHPSATTDIVGKDQLLLSGQLTEYKQKRTGQTLPSVLRYAARLSIQAEGGQVTSDAGKVAVANADAVTLLLAADTSFLRYDDVSGDPVASTERTIAAATAKSYPELLDAHLQDYRRLFRRVHLDLGASAAASQSTDQRIQHSTQQEDPQLAALYFQYGRYLLISSSRPGSQPANLQGIWNDQLHPPWESKWTTNINLEMNYWPAETTNLAECHEPLFDLLRDLSETGAKTAERHYGCRGWVLHHNSDVWRGAAPINHANHGIWPTGGAWLCQHLWEHYQFTRDERFLREQAYPIIKAASQFFVDFLVEDPRHGWLISTPSNSPEQGGLIAGPTMDHQIIRDLLRNCIAAATVLDLDSDLRQQLKEIVPRIAPNQIGRHGQLQEWLEDRDDPKNQHRHVSHLWAVHPGREITPRGTPELSAAARQSLEFRGDGGTGWSLAWKINLWARFHDGPRAHRLLSNLLTSQRTYPNLFDAHPPFQIDGNFGGASGIAEMLLQSHADEIAILPAWPAEHWPTGHVRGLRARGGMTVAIAWQDGRAQWCELAASVSGTHKVRAPAGHRIAAITASQREVTDWVDEAGCVTLTLDPDQTYRIGFE